MSGDKEKDAWLQRVLGVSVDRTVLQPAKRQVRFDPVTAEIPKRGSGIVIGSGKDRSAGTIAAPPVPTVTTVTAASGKQLKIARKADGRVVYTAPPPAVSEITFSGGGGKGTALPGAVKALHESGVLKNAKTIAGASVGSMTAALVAAGIKPDEFEAIADDPVVTAQIKEGKKPGLALIRYILTKSEGSSLTGKGLENAVRDALDDTLRRRVTDYIEDCSNQSTPVDPTVTAVLKKLSSNKSGPTFGDYRTLSRVIPGIKEVAMTGTYMIGYTTEIDERGKEKKAKLDADKGQPYLFDADHEPDLEVAIAVHASASFPGSFKPIDVKLSSGITVTFIDGGVMNNTPTSASLGLDRESDRERILDPMPQQRGVTFIFEDEEGAAAAMKKGRADPKQGGVARFLDARLLGGAGNAGAEYGKNRSAADRPSEIVVVPLTGEVTRKGKKGDKVEKIDMRGNFGGTLNFEPPMEHRLQLRALTEKATQEQIDADKKPKTREFASESQMFVSIPIDELKVLADQGVPNADAAFRFRDKVAVQIAILLSSAQAAYKDRGQDAEALTTGEANEALSKLDALAGADVDFQGYVGRELSKKLELDSLLAAARRINRGTGNKSPTMTACDAVAEKLQARGQADHILKQIVYPKMKQEPQGGAGILTLLTVEQLLRTANSATDINQAIDYGVAHFRKKADNRVPRRGHKRFAKMLDQRRMKLPA